MDFFNQQIYHFDSTLNVYHDKEKYRELTLNRLKEFINSGLIEETFEPKKYLEIFNHIHLIDGSFAVKVGVNFGLFGISILKLGTDKHKHFIQKLVTGEILGCFAMTEVSHGSDVKNIKTTATYNKQKNTFLLNSNGIENKKCWIGNAMDATHGVVFAQLIADKNYGVHAFVVDLKNVKRFDLGDKNGLQGVDNGMLEFENVEIEYDCLLDRFSKIEHGVFISNLNSEKRFGAMLAALTLGRVAISFGVLQFAKKALYLSLQYAMSRKQFSFDNKQETEIIEYPSLNQRLIPRLCSLLVYETFLQKLTDIYVTSETKVHKLSSGCKPIITWFALETIQQCRECYGGNGYSLKNQIGILKNDADIYTTFEGDNHMLLQQLGKILFTKYSKKLKDTSYLTKTMLFLKSHFVSTLDSILSLMKYKFLKQLVSCLLHFKNLFKSEKNIQVIWNKNQNQIIECAKSYTDYKIAKIAKSNSSEYQVHMIQWLLKNQYYFISKQIINKNIIKIGERKMEELNQKMKLNLQSYLKNMNMKEYMFSKL